MIKLNCNIKVFYLTEIFWDAWTYRTTIQMGAMSMYRNTREYKYLFFMEGFRQLFGLWTLVSYHVSQECRSIRTFARSFLGRHRAHAAICCVWIHLWGNKPFVLRFIASIINVDVMKFCNVLALYFLQGWTKLVWSC